MGIQEFHTGLVKAVGELDGLGLDRGYFVAASYRMVKVEVAADKEVFTCCSDLLEKIQDMDTLIVIVDVVNRYSLIITDPEQHRGGQPKIHIVLEFHVPRQLGLAFISDK
ncbi:hypothetical protein FVER14953_20059 [Fusarium verticillioides]|nr:hypothetical protein FVER14953_20059 [Fusarium verticillioides]